MIKKIVISLTLMMLPLCLLAQSIEEDKMMHSTNKRVMSTSWQKINWDSDDYRLEISMMLEGTDRSMRINWLCSEMIGSDRDAEVVLFFEDMSRVTLHNKKFSVSGVGKVRTKEVGATIMGIQIDAKGNFGTLMDKTLKVIRLNTTSGEIDFPVSANESMALRKLYVLFDKHAEKN